MTAKRVQFASAVTLVEVAVSMTIIAILALGTLSYQYHTGRQARIACAQITATRTAQLLLEDWKSTGGSETYDPAALKLGFSSQVPLSSYWSNGLGAGSGTYTITIDGFPMVIILAWADVEHDSTAGVTLRQLTVTIGFGEIPGKGKEIICEEGLLAGIPPIIMTTYVRCDASSG